MSEAARVASGGGARAWPVPVAAGAAVVSIVLGVTVLAGWVAHLAVLIQILPDWPPMPRNTAACFLLSGAALLMVTRRRRRWLTVACAGAILTVSVLTIFEFVFGVNAGIDELLGPSYIVVQLSHPGRMAPISAVCFAMCAMALAAAPSIPTPRSTLLLALIGSMIVAVGVTTTITIALGSSDAFSWATVTRLALHTAIGLTVLGAGLVALAWDAEHDPSGTPRWLPVGAVIGVTTGGVGLLEALMADEHAPFSPLLAVALGGGCALAGTVGLTVSLAQRAHSQTVQLRRTNGILEAHIADVRQTEALLKTGALQSAIFNSANFSSIATDAKGVIQIFNVGAERMLGYAAAEVMNQITPADISDPQEVIARARALSAEIGTPITPGFEALVFKASRGIEDIYELTYIRKDGSRFPAVVSVTALRDAPGAIIGYLLIGTDNTARQQVEEERRKLDQRLRDQHFYTRSLIESNIDALMTTDPRGIITDVNKQMEALTGSTRDELIGAPFRTCFTDPSRAEAGIKRVLGEGTVTNYELTARARDGKETVVSCNATTFHDRDRRLQGVFAAARDVTELKRFEHTLRQKNEELEDASRMKSEFLANMSHELRTPLNAIIGFSEVLRDGLMGELTGQQRGFVGDIFSSGTHLLSLINDILDLSKVEAGKMTLDLEPLQVSSLFMQSLSIVREKAAARHIRLNMDAADEPGVMQADARKVKQIVYNLLSNAVKFSVEGGEVTLRARDVPRAGVGRLSRSRPARTHALADSAFVEFLEISVTDTGIGIAPAEMERLFKPFSQIDSGLARKFEGTGLGLALVKLLAELHGGTVAVDSAVGAGSCFTVWLPLRPPEAGAIAPAAARRGEPASVCTALVVEDDEHAAQLIRVQLEAEGFTVRHAASAEEALVLAAEQPPSLITLDITLPRMDGWEMLGRLKQVPELRRIPVVIISITADRNKGFSLGAAAVMQKPISRLELYRSLVDLGLFPPARDRTLKVLVVDDDAAAVELIAARISGLAGTVLRAYDGREAIAVARDTRPDVIVLDLMMPEVNGFAVVEALQDRPATAHIPIVVVTAARITAADRARLNGYVAAIMEKAAFDQERFTAEVRRAMAGRPVVA